MQLYHYGHHSISLDAKTRRVVLTVVFSRPSRRSQKAEFRSFIALSKAHGVTDHHSKASAAWSQCPRRLSGARRPSARLGRPFFEYATHIERVACESGSTNADWFVEASNTAAHRTNGRTWKVRLRTACFRCRADRSFLTKNACYMIMIGPCFVDGAEVPRCFHELRLWNILCTHFLFVKTNVHCHSVMRENGHWWGVEEWAPGWCNGNFLID